MNNTLYNELFGIHAGKEIPFLIRPDGTVITYEKFLRLGIQFAHALTNLGISSGDRLLVHVEKSPEVLALYAACIQSGIVFVPLNPAYTIDELSYFIADSQPSLVVCDASNLHLISPLAVKMGFKLETLNQDASGSLSEKGHDNPHDFPTVSRTMDDLATILYTSGTTGQPKGAMHTQGNLLSNGRILRDLWQFDTSDVLLHALPIFHSHGLFVATNVSLLAGGSMILLPGFDIDEIIRLIPQSTVMMGVPTFYSRLLDSPRFTKDLTKEMRLFVSGSAPLLAETHVQFEKRTGHRILERYGLTETSMNTSNPYEGERRPGTVGFPLPGIEVKITDPTSGKPIPAGEIGQIEVRGPNVCKGYWKKPTKTTAEFRPDGFFITGDLGRFDSQGYIHIEGRNKDLIISGGFNIYPKEIELLLDGQTVVLESAVIGVPHDDFGEVAVGLIVPSNEVNPDVDQIRSVMSTSLARYKIPKKILIVDSLPRNTMGKVQKNLLRDKFRNLFQNN